MNLPRELNTKTLYNVKLFNKRRFSSKDVSSLVKEFKKQLFLDHSNIVKLFHIINDKDFIYALYEPCMQDDLATLLKHNDPFSEKEVRAIIKQVCIALEHMHRLDILHLKLRL